MPLFERFTPFPLEEHINGLLAVDAVSGEEFLRLVATAKTEDVALYFGELCKECVQEKIKHLTIIEQY